MRIFTDVFSQNRKAALKNREKKDEKNFTSTSKRSFSYSNRSSGSPSAVSEKLVVNNNYFYNTFAAESISDEFEKDCRRYSMGFEKDYGVIDV